jgi:Chalcone-flavanone isomerase
MILPLTGEQYSDKVSENCMAHWKAMGILTEAEVDAVNTFKQLFKPETFPPGSSILFTHSPSGALSVCVQNLIVIYIYKGGDHLTMGYFDNLTMNF